MTSPAAAARFDFSLFARTAIDRLAIAALLGRRAIWMTAVGRMDPCAPAAVALTPTEIALVDRLARGGGATRTLATALDKLARIGDASGASRRLAPPLAIARGLSQIAELQIAARLRAGKYLEAR